MKSRYFIIFFISTIFIAFPVASQAVTLPIEYTGELKISVIYGTSHCEGVSPIWIALSTDGKLRADYDMEVRYSGTGPNTCEIVHQTMTSSGTHDKTGTFKLPIEIISSYFVVNITGTFDDLKISGNGSTADADGFMTVSLSFEAYATNQPPKITLDPATYPEFQVNILEGKGFSVKIRKEDGVMDSQGNWKLNWSTLAFLTDGMDNSMNFIDKIANIVTWSVDDTGKEVRFDIKPKPEDFMHNNMFNIKWNGEHIISMSICDTDNRCEGIEYNIYFGPFIWAQSVTDLRCTIYLESVLDIDMVVVGNTGYESPKTQLYVLLFKTEDDYWFLSDYYIWTQGIMTSFGGFFNSPEANLVKSNILKLDISYSLTFGAKEYKPFPAGNYQFFALLLDNDSGASKGFDKAVTTCY